MAAVVCLLLSVGAYAAPEFPNLSGRVVDDARMLSTVTVRGVTELAAAHEQATTNQYVVVTLPDLQGYSIEEFGYQLGRHWGIGQQGKDNGVLLIIAQDERKLRIEVGYGLEGQLTDAIASNIINGVITPEFKAGRFDRGVVAGSQAIIQALGGEYKMKETRRRSSQETSPGWKIFAFIMFFFVLPGLMGRRGFLWWMLGSSLSSGSGRSRGGSSGFGGGGFGGFSGGGGSFGGGGASGGW